MENYLFTVYSSPFLLSLPSLLPSHSPPFPPPNHPPSNKHLPRFVSVPRYSLTNYTISPHRSRENLNPMKDNKNYCSVFTAQSEHLLMHMACQALFYSMLRHEKKACMTVLIIILNAPIASSLQSQRIRQDHLSVGRPPPPSQIFAFHAQT